MPSNIGWSEDETELLIKLWVNDKLTSTQIALRVGHSRSGVMSKLRRLGIDDTRRAPKAAVPKVKVKPLTYRIKKKSVRPPTVPPAMPQIGPGIGVPFLEARSNQCKAIIGSSTGPNGLAVFCGERVEDGSNFEFCKKHMALYTTPAWRR